MNEQERLERARVVEVARSWCGTPYHDCACVKGHGVDCAYLLKAVFEEAGLESPIDIAAYSPQFFLHRSDEKYIDKVLERAVEISEAQALPGDVVLWRIGRCFAHGAIVVDPGWPSIIHAFRQAGIVTLGEGDQGELATIGAAEGGATVGVNGKPRPRRFFTRRGWARS